MTRSEAIKILWQYDVNFEPHPAEDVMHAIDMAIEALQREQQRREDIYECQYCFGEVHKNYIYCPFCGKRIEALEQEETLQNLTKPNKSDLIVKGAGEIKDGLYNIKDGKLFQYKANGGTVRTYPIVSADRPTGHWTENAQEYYEMINEKCGGVDENTPYFTDDIACSECLAKFSVIDNETERFDFCPNCGCAMKGGEEE